jgi:hypothetical protein
MLSPDQKPLVREGREAVRRKILEARQTFEIDLRRFACFAKKSLYSASTL